LAGSVGTAEPSRGDVAVVRDGESAVSVELMPLREGVARGFLRMSPRVPKLSWSAANALSEELRSRGFSRLLAQDSRKRVLRRLLVDQGWTAANAVDSNIARPCRAVAPYDVPLDEKLVDERGSKADLAGTSNMSGIRIELGGRQAWAFYTDDGDAARVVSDGERKQGLLIASDTNDMFEAAECLVRYLATTRKSWAVFSMDLGRFIRQYDPMVMWRMVLEQPRPYEHKARPYSASDRRALVKLFSEYYDEPSLNSRMRLRAFVADKNYSIQVVEGGFVIVRFENETGLIYDIYVTPSHQGEGLGGELMRAALTSLTGRVSSVYLHTSYPRAKSLYEKFGFKTTYSQLSIRLDEVAFAPPPSR